MLRSQLFMKTSLRGFQCCVFSSDVGSKWEKQLGMMGRRERERGREGKRERERGLSGFAVKKNSIEEYNNIYLGKFIYIYMYVYKETGCSLSFEGFYAWPVYLSDFDYSFYLISGFHFFPLNCEFDTQLC